MCIFHHVHEEICFRAVCDSFVQYDRSYRPHLEPDFASRNLRTRDAGASVQKDAPVAFISRHFSFNILGGGFCALRRCYK